MMPGDKTGFGQRGKRWFTGDTQTTRRLEARVTRLEADRITTAKRMDPRQHPDVIRLINVIADLPAAPPGVQLSDRRRAEIAHALKPFGVNTYQPPHQAPAEKDAA